MNYNNVTDQVFILSVLRGRCSGIDAEFDYL